MTESSVLREKYTDAEGAAVLVVDLDQSLICTDMTIESVLKFIGFNPLNIFSFFWWMVQGRGVLKAKLAAAGIPNIDTVPINLEVLEFIQAEKKRGAKIVLASASNMNVVEAIARRFGLFDEVIGSTSENNMKGAQKAAELNQRFGEGGYTYVGDSPADLKVWKYSKRAVTVGASSRFKRRVEQISPDATHIRLAARSKANVVKSLAKQLRPHQWAKNLLIAVPAFAAHEFSAQAYLTVLIAFVVFSLTASSVYVTNDLLDLESDRLHPRKKLRPFASGVLPIKLGFVLAPALLLLALSLTILFLPLIFLLVLILYYGLTLSYSLFLKTKIMVDVFVLAALYTIRIIAGGAAVEIPISPWLLGFSVFFFLSLAIIKRITELVDIIKSDREGSSKRDYVADDLSTIQSLGAASGYASIVVLIFYFTSPEAMSLYESPELLWGISPLLLFWISRMLAIAGRGHMHDDPIVFAAKDRTSHLVGLIVGAVILTAIVV